MPHPSHPLKQSRFLLSLVSLLVMSAPLPAHALDVYGGCGMAGVPVTGWNGNTDNVSRTVKIKCGESKKFSVQFNARVTQGDKDAGGFIFRLVDEDAISDDLLLSATVKCQKVADLPVGTELVCSADFTLKCTDDCEVEGVSIEEIVINEMPPKTKLLCKAKNPSCSTGSSGESVAYLALEDSDDDENDRLCNQLNVECTRDGSVSRWEEDPRLHPGESKVMTLVASQPVFTDATDISWGLERGIEIDFIEVTPDRITTGIFVPSDYRPGPLVVYVNNIELGESQVPFTIEPLHWATLDAGNIELTVTDRGIVGHSDRSLSTGDGLVYPTRVENLLGNGLYTGSLWLGADPLYVANNDYAAEPTADFAEVPGTHVELIEDGIADQHLVATYEDSGADTPLGLVVRQDSWCFADPLRDDFVVVQYTVTSTGPRPISGLLAGLFLDLDLGHSGLDDVGGVDEEHQVVWSGDEEGMFVAVGVAGGDSPLNLSLCPNPIYVWPEEYIADEDKFAFLAGVLHQSEGMVPDDYSIVASVDLGDLAPGEQRSVTFFVAGGTSMVELFEHVDVARATIDGSTNVEDAPVSGIGLSCHPNPSRGSVSIEWSPLTARNATVDVFDGSGRLVRRLLEGSLDSRAPLRLEWDGTDGRSRLAPSGLYFVRLAAPGTERVQRVTILR